MEKENKLFAQFRAFDKATRFSHTYIEGCFLCSLQGKVILFVCFLWLYDSPGLFLLPKRANSLLVSSSRPPNMATVLQCFLKYLTLFCVNQLQYLQKLYPAAHTLNAVWRTGLQQYWFLPHGGRHVPITAVLHIDFTFSTAVSIFLYLSFHVKGNERPCKHLVNVIDRLFFKTASHSQHIPAITPQSYWSISQIPGVSWRCVREDLSFHILF